MIKYQQASLENYAYSPEVEEAYRGLHRVIDNLDQHVQDLIKRHQGQFMVAYRNHLTKVKDELTALKKKAEQQQRTTSGVTKISKLQRQVALFREEALKVYTKLQQKTRQCEDYQTKLSEAEQSNQKYEWDIKQLCRRLKLAEVKNKELNFMQFQNQKQQKVEETQRKEAVHPSMRATGMLSQTTSSVSDILDKYFPDSVQAERKTALTQLNNILKFRENEIIVRLSKATRNQLLSQVLDEAATSSDLKDWFIQCVMSVKKEISKRNPNTAKMKQEILKVTSIRQFLRIDKLRLLELFVADQSILTLVYNKLFPDRRMEIQRYLSEIQVEPLDVPNHQYQEHFQQIEHPDRPKVGQSANKPKKELVRNRVVIKNGKLTLS